MNNWLRFSLRIAAILVLSTAAFGQQVKRTSFDVTNYVMDVQLSPIDNKLTATVDVTFVPKEVMRSVAFELNGSLKVDDVSRIGAAAAPPATTPTKGKPAAKPPSPSGTAPLTFIQDQAGGSSDLGPHVRIELGTDAAAGAPVTLRFKYNGILNLPSGGPLLNKRLAYIGENNGYLMYAARWFPFHDYAADPATADITISLPSTLHVAAYS